MTLNYYASQRQFGDHLYPIYRETGGRFYADPQIYELFPGSVPCHREFIRDTVALDGGTVVTAAIGDHSLVRRTKQPMVLVNHGVGQAFDAPHPSYSGGHRKGVSLYVEPNEYAAEKTRQADPDARVVVAGCPKLDDLTQTPKPRNTEPVVAISFHWDCLVFPETRSAWAHFARALPKLKAQFPNMIGHGHPRDWPKFEKEYRRLNIEPVRDFADVVKRADVYVCDGVSTLYEFAALDRPVVVMNSPYYRRHINHGLRFWDYADVGVQVWDWKALPGAIVQALIDVPEQAARRREIVQNVYPNIGNASRIAASAILQLEEERTLAAYVSYTQRNHDGTYTIHGYVEGQKKSVRVSEITSLADCTAALVGTHKAKPPLSEMTVQALRQYARENQIPIPAGVTRKDDIRLVIEGNNVVNV